ncbi:single-stranded-DNA-specific exonuclease RecJ [Moorella sulfitireducens (nom. illeg.)]|uniref:single-stranded-DNA-specific exonuclease RecJ n=1 Tax=Neomoorella sulfitireducens TaxID=2972948 RepID=UPI0021AD037E|nr:single-stranded-DNA-specific exonuclease RecJ [Moorella sulfitireducens]
MKSTRWAMPPVNPVERLALARELHISPVTAQILLNRGITTVEAARAFFHPDPANLFPPEKIPGLAAARERLVRAIVNREKIMVHGDYDVDGLAATAIILETLARLGVEAEVYIPDRLAEGYGLKKKGLIKALELNCRLVITVDCGINSLEEAIFAREQGLDLIITDHHRPGTVLPQADAVVNPLLGPDLLPLCGAGVAFKLAQSLAAHFGLATQEGVAAGWALDLVALATIADAVPLLGENRLLVQLGLKALARKTRPGLKALGEVAGLPAREWTAREVAYGLAPRLNACGRLGSAMPALEILLTDSTQQALELARHMQEENQARRQLEESVTAEAETMAVTALAEGAKGLVLASEDWHPGVIGIIAARLVEKYNCPVVLIALAGDRGRGSGRSIPGINLHEILTRCRSHLLAFGGHALAAGLEIATKEIPAFRAAFNEVVKLLLAKVQPAPEIAPDAEVLFSQLDWELLAELEGLAPFGEGNPRPLLVCSNVLLKTARQVGSNGAHLKLTLWNEGRQIEAIGFNLQLPQDLAPGERVDLAFYLERNNYQGREELQLSLAAIRPSERITTIPVISREQVAATVMPGAGTTWCWQLQRAVNKDSPVTGFLFATGLAVRQCYCGLKRHCEEPVFLRPLGPWLGQAGVNRVLAGEGAIITCYPFWPAGAGAGKASFLVSALVSGEKGAGYLLPPASTPATWQVIPELLPTLKELLARGQNILLYEKDAARALRLGDRLRQELPGIRLAVDTFLDARPLWLVTEAALSGRLPLLVASREMPVWFYPAGAVIFNYSPGSQEEIELALPGMEQVPEVYINLRGGDRQPEDLRRELAVFYRRLQEGTNNGNRLYIINNKGYHQRWYLAIFEELGLIRVESRGGELAVHLQEVAARRNLMTSRRYRQLLAETEKARQFYRQIAGGR